MIRQTDRFIIPAPSTDTVVRKKANSRGLCKRNFYGKLNRSLDAKFNGQRKQDWVTKSAAEATNAKRDRIRAIRGIDLDQLQTKTKRSTLSLERTSYSSSFDCELSTRFESIQVTTTNDYWTCEEWCEAIRRQKTKFLGMTLYHAFLSEPPPQPDPQYRPRSRYRKENSTKKPPPLPPGGPLLLREEGSVIVLMILATEGQILLLQLRHMRVIGPNLRALLEDPFVCKCGRNLVELRKVLRQDGVQSIGVHDIQQFFLRSIRESATRKKTKEILKQAKFHVFLKSITGVDLASDEYPAYVWGEDSLTDDQVKVAATEAWGCWALVEILQLIDPKTIPLLSGITWKIA